MANVLFYSKNGDAYALALEMARSKHDVKFLVKQPEAKNTGARILNPKTLFGVTPKWDEFDLTIFDMVGNGAVADSLRKRKFIVFGSSLLGDKLELDRVYGSDVAKLTRAIVVEPKEFNSIPEGMKFLEKQEEPYVFKPLENASPLWTYVAKDDNRALLSFMKHLPKQNLNFILQKKVDGIEISSEGWFHHEVGWLPLFNHTIEHKRFMEGDKGVNTGCMGNIVWISGEPTKLHSTLLTPLTEFLTRARYIGPLDMNTIVTEKGPVFLEWTARFGYDAIQTMSELLIGSLFDVIYGAATGTGGAAFKKNKVACGVRLSISPYPHEEKIRETKGFKMLDVPKEAINHVWLSDVMMNEDNELVTAGVDGVLGCVTAIGEDIREARRRCYRTIENIILSKDIQFRQDIGLGTEEKIQTLKSKGWI